MWETRENEKKTLTDGYVIVIKTGNSLQETVT